jgi:AbrB family looped-hinge helix DNA binding protein
MAKVDSKGRIVLPQEVRESLGITPGSEVDIREEDGKAVVEPEDNPEQIIERMEELIDGISDDRHPPTPYEDLDPQSKDHVDTIRRQAQQAESDRTDE